MIKQRGISRHLILLIISATIVLASSCKLRVVVSEGGRVVSLSGAYECESGQSCKLNVVDVFFDETFTAVAAEGHYFRRWNSGERALCADSYGDCRLSTVGFAGNEILEGFLESEEVFFLRALFAQGKL